MSGMKQLFVVFFVLSGVMLLGACTKNYVHLQPLEESIATWDGIYVGEIEDALSSEVEADDRPSQQDIADFRSVLQEELDEKELISVVGMPDLAQYHVTGSIVDFKKGSGFLRFIIGFGVGNAKLTVNLRVVESATGAVLYSGNYKGIVSSGYESGAETYKRVAKDFAKQLSKQIEKLREENRRQDEPMTGL